MLAWLRAGSKSAVEPKITKPMKQQNREKHGRLVLFYRSQWHARDQSRRGECVGPNIYPRYELLAVGEASTDDAPERLRKYGERIHLIQ